MFKTIKKSLIKCSNDSFGIALVLTATLLLSLRSILVKLAYIEGVSVMSLFYYRFLFTVPLLLGFSFYKKRRLVFTTILSKPILIGCTFAGLFGYYLATLLDFHSLKLIDANINRLIVYTFPIYVLLLNSIIEKRLPKSTDMLVFASVQVGLFFVLGGIHLSLTFTDTLGTLFALFASISYAIYIIINQQIGKKIGSILFTTYAVTFSFIFINIHFFSVYTPENTITALSGNALIIIVIMAIFCTFLPLLLISEGIKRIGASRFSLINASGPVMTILLAFIFLSETMTTQQIIGATSV